MPNSGYETESKNYQLDALLRESNIADKLEEKNLLQIGADVKKGYDSDVESRKEWETKYDQVSDPFKLIVLTTNTHTNTNSPATLSDTEKQTHTHEQHG